MASEIKDYEFKCFDGLTIVQDDGSIEAYDFKEFRDEEVYNPQEVRETIKIERDYAQRNDFLLSPIVKEHRGHNEQEQAEKERRIQDEVEKRVDAIKADAFQEAYSAGLEQGREEVFQQTRAQTEEKLANLTEMIDEALALKDQIFSNQKKDLSRMIKVLTKWIVLKELETDDDYLERLLEKLILEMQSKSNLLIRVAEKDFQNMPDVLEHVQKKVGELKNVRVEIDHDNQLGGMILESENGIIRGNIEEQLKSLDKIFESLGVQPNDEMGES